MNRVECYIKGCLDLSDPLDHPEELSALDAARRERIRKYRTPADRKRGFCAGLMIAEHFSARGKRAEEITTGPHGRPQIEGLDFNISHAGDYVMMVLSDHSVGCDIERIRDKKTGIAKRFFSEAEAAWIDASEDPFAAFYRVWTARESYVKYTGEGISLDFQKYEIRFDDASREAPLTEGDLREAQYLGSAAVMRDGVRQDCMVFQWRYDENYVLSLCCDIAKGVCFA